MTTDNPTCAKCEATVLDDLAVRCPRCGAPLQAYWRKLSRSVVALAAVAMFVVAGLLGIGIF